MPKRGEGRFSGYKQVYSEKQLPDKYLMVYRLEYTRMRTYYKKQLVDIENPMFNLLCERIASLTATLRYMESPDFSESNEYGLENPLMLKEFNNTQNSLNRTMEQIMKYTVATVPKETKKSVTSRSISVKVKNINELSEDAIEKRITELFRGGETRIIESSSGEEKT